MVNVIRLMAFIVILSILPRFLNAQSVSINTDGTTADASAMLDIKSTLKGMLIPRMSKSEKNGIASPATGLLIYQNAPDSTGFYFYNGSNWSWLSNSSTAWSTTGNNGTSAATNFLGTIDSTELVFRSKNIERMRLMATGELGIGTSNPKVKLDVSGSATVGSGNINNATNSMVTGVNNTVNGLDVVIGGINNYVAPGYGFAIAVGNQDSVAGSATAVFGYLNKVTAFEAFAAGDRNTASGGASAAFGGSNTASGSSAFVTGFGNNVPGTQAAAFGQNNIVSGSNALVSGNGNIVSATSSFVSGISNTVNGIDVLIGGTNNYVAPGFGHAIAVGNLDSIAGSATAVFGFLNKVTAFEAFAAGDRNTASGGASTAFGGSNTVSGSTAFAAGFGNTVSGAQAAAFGQGNNVSASNSLALGNSNTITGSGTLFTGGGNSGNAVNSLVTGINNSVNGTDNFVSGQSNFAVTGIAHTIVAGILDSAYASACAVFGYLNKVTSFTGFATGDRNLVTGQTSAAFGGLNIASGSNAFVTGLQDTASGNSSTAFGTANNSASYSETALGMYGTTYTPVSVTGYNIADRIFNIGIGTSAARADAFTILKSGNTGIGTAAPTALLDINSNTLRLRNAKTPASATDTGNTGDIAWDSNYIYVCVATNTWKRVAIASW